MATATASAVLPKFQYEAVMKDNKLAPETLPETIRRKITGLSLSKGRFLNKPTDKGLEELKKMDAVIADMILDHVEGPLPDDDGTPDDLGTPTTEPTPPAPPADPEPPKETELQKYLKDHDGKIHHDTLAKMMNTKKELPDELEHDGVKLTYQGGVLGMGGYYHEKK